MIPTQCSKGGRILLIVAQQAQQRRKIKKEKKKEKKKWCVSRIKVERTTVQQATLAYFVENATRRLWATNSAWTRSLLFWAVTTNIRRRRPEHKGALDNRRKTQWTLMVRPLAKRTKTKKILCVNRCVSHQKYIGQSENVNHRETPTQLPSISSTHPQHASTAWDKKKRNSCSGSATQTKTTPPCMPKSKELVRRIGGKNSRQEKKRKKKKARKQQRITRVQPAWQEHPLWNSLFLHIIPQQLWNYIVASHHTLSSIHRRRVHSTKLLLEKHTKPSTNRVDASRELRRETQTKNSPTYYFNTYK